MNPRLDPNIVGQQIANLILQYPELAEDETLRADMIEGETDAFDFLRRLVRLIGDAGALSGGTAAYIAELRERQARIDRRIEAFRLLAFKVMESADLSKVELAEATLAVRKGSRKIIITDEQALPNQCFKVTREPSRSAIKALLDAGIEVSGAIYSNGENSLMIKVK